MFIVDPHKSLYEAVMPGEQEIHFIRTAVGMQGSASFPLDADVR